MESVEVAWLNSINPIKIEDVALISMYMGRRMARIRVAKIPQGLTRTKFWLRYERI